MNDKFKRYKVLHWIPGLDTYSPGDEIHLYTDICGLLLWHVWTKIVTVPADYVKGDYYMILLDKETVLQIFKPPPPPALAKWLHVNDFQGSVYDPCDDLTGKYTLSCAVHWAASRHPAAEILDIASFAGLVQYYATGTYGGYMTDEYPKEHIIDSIILTLADIPTEEPTPEETERIIGILDHAYFGDLTDAITEILENVSHERAAKIVLNIAQSKADYHDLAKTAKKFLARKNTIGELRKAVKKIADKMQLLKTTLLLTIPIETYEDIKDQARKNGRTIPQAAAEILSQAIKDKAKGDTF